MVNKNSLTTDWYEQFRPLPLESFSSKPGQQVSRQSLSHHDYADADIIHLATFFRNNPNAVLVFSPDGALVKINPAAVRLFKRLQLEPADTLPVEHSQIVQTCLEGRFKEYTIEVTTNDHILALTYHPLSSFKLVYVYAIEITEYRRSETELLQIAVKTIALAKRAVLQLQAFRSRLPQPTVPAIAMPCSETASDSIVLTDWFVSMDGCVFGKE